MDSSSTTRLAKPLFDTSEVLREAFLERLRSGGKTKYKRYTASPLRYAGGKSLAVGLIVEIFPPGLKRLVSPFVGGGSVEVAAANELGLEVVAYDVFDILCNYWQVQLQRPEALADRLRSFSPSRQTFSDVKRVLAQHWDGETSLDSLELAAHYYFNTTTSYGPHFLGWPSDIYLQPQRYANIVEKVAKFRAPTLSVHTSRFEESIPNHMDDFLYCDPPYYLADGQTFTGMYPHRNFPVHHVGFQHELLRDYLLSHRGGFVLSYNDCDTIREWYKGCNLSAPSWQYTFGQGDTRIGANRMGMNGGSHIKKSHELLIWRMPSGNTA